MKTWKNVLLGTVILGAGLVAGEAQAGTTFPFGRCIGAEGEYLVENDTISARWLGGQLLMYRDDGKLFFESNAANSSNRLCLQNDGNMVVYNSAGTAIWNTETHGTGVTYMEAEGCALKLKTSAGETKWELQQEGCHDTKVSPSWCRDLTQPGTIVSNETLSLVWEVLGSGTSQSGQLMAYGYLNGQYGWPYWGVTEANKVCFQDDGNFVVYSKTNYPLFASNTAGYGSFASLMVDEGGVAVSVSNTDLWRAAHDANPPTSKTNTWCRRASAGGTLLESGDTRLTWWGGALSLYYGGSNLLWAASTGNANATLCHGNDGSLYIADGNNVLWRSHTSTSTNTTTTLKVESCKVSLVNSSGTTVWSQSSTYCSDTLTGNGFSYGYDKDFGNSKFGAGLWAGVAALDYDSLSAVRSNAANSTGVKNAMGSLYSSDSGVHSSLARLGANAGADVTIFSKTKTIIEADAYVTNEGGTQANYAGLEMLGTVVYSKSAQATLSYGLEREFFSVSTTFTLLAIPITVEGAAVGSMGVSGSLSPGSTGATIVITPNANITGEGSAGVGAFGFSAGFYGELTIIDVSVPLTVNLDLKTKKYSTNASLDLATLDGSVGLYAKGFGKKATKELASWEGLSWSYSLLSRSGTL